MGQLVPYTVTMNSELSLKFLKGTYTLEEGRHITPEDSFAVLISRELEMYALSDFLIMVFCHG